MKPKAITGLLVIVLILGFVVRLKDIKAPLADWHSFRQADTASVAREYVKHGINLLEPKYQDLSNIQSGQENPKGYRMVEFPLISGFVASLYRVVPQLQLYELHVVYRLITILFSLLSAFLLYQIVKKLESPFTGLLTAAVFLFLPYSIFYSRAILPETPMITFSLLAIFFGLRFIDKQQLGDGILLCASSAIALLLKPVAVFLIFPLIPYALSRRGFKALINPAHLIIALLAVIPLFWWRRWITNYPAGIPDAEWLLNSNDIRFKGAFFYWIFADRIGRLILGYWGTALVALGLLVKKKSNLIIFLTLSTLVYLVIFATGNVQHDYYQIPIIPIIAILIAYGIQWLLTNQVFSKLSSWICLVTCLLFLVSFSWYHVRAYYGINNSAIVSAGKAVDTLTPPDALIIAPYMGDTAFLYQTNRRGWPIGFNIEDRIKAGATYYVSVNNDDETRELIQKYTLVKQTPEYSLIQLVPQTALVK